MRFDEWPPDGRVGLAVSGDYEGEYLFIFPERDGQWGCYSSSGDDEVFPDAEWLEEWLRGVDIEWLSPEDDVRVEKTVFAMRPLTSVFDPDPTALDRLRAWFRRRQSHS